jgi:hypothetical protein
MIYKSSDFLGVFMFDKPFVGGADAPISSTHVANIFFHYDRMLVLTEADTPRTRCSRIDSASSISNDYDVIGDPAIE